VAVKEEGEGEREWGDGVLVTKTRSMRSGGRKGCMGGAVGKGRLWWAGHTYPGT